jgi:hypothetical protein
VHKLDPTSPEAAQSAEGKPCPGEGMIDNTEDGDAQIATVAGRSGYWYTFIDEQGSDIVPTPGTRGGVFEMTEGGADGTQFAARASGTVADGVDPFAGVGFNFTDPKSPFDASRYSGITFFAKRGPGSTREVRIKLPDINTEPDGEVCAGCYNDFARDIELTNEWTRYTIPFPYFKQLEPWGDPIMGEVDASQLFSVQFHVKDPGADFDIWIDEIQFTGCQ